MSAGSIRVFSNVHTVRAGYGGSPARGRSRKPSHGDSCLLQLGHGFNDGGCEVVCRVCSLRR